MILSIDRVYQIYFYRASAVAPSPIGNGCNMDVTVLSLVYNHAAYLPALFAGLRVQDPDIAIQWIIINDASTDASGELLQALSRTLPPNIHITIIHPLS